MGVCLSQEIDSNILNKGNKEEVVLFLIDNLKRLEETILKLRKEDVHYRMTRLMFLLNALKELTPVIRRIEDSDNNLEYFRLREEFEIIFAALLRNDRDRYTRSVYILSDIMEGKTHREENNIVNNNSNAN